MQCYVAMDSDGCGNYLIVSSVIKFSRKGFKTDYQKIGKNRKCLSNTALDLIAEKFSGKNSLKLVVNNIKGTGSIDQMK